MATMTLSGYKYNSEELISVKICFMCSYFNL